MKARWLLLLLPGLLPACATGPTGADPEGIVVTASADSGPAAGVSFRVENRTGRTIFLARCGERIMAAVDRWESERWVSHASDACQAVQRMDPLPLDPGAAAGGAQAVQLPGRYRLRLGAASARGEPTVWDVTSPDFTISR